MTLARRLQLGVLAIGLAAVIGPVAFVASKLHFGEPLIPVAAAYPSELPAACAEGARPGPAAGSNLERTERGIRYAVRAPTNYRPTAAHPLIVVYAPRGANRFLVERFVGLTRDATAAGFVIAFVDAAPLSRDSIAALAEVPAAVASRWCIDQDRVSLTGHSDGGTAAAAIAFGAATRGLAAAVAPSGAGIRGAALADESCPAPLSVMIVHASDDGLFPGYGAEAARWWAGCNGCDPEPAAAAADGCRAYAGCAAGAPTFYCAPEGGHLDWLVDRSRLIELFAAARRRSPDG